MSLVTDLRIAAAKFHAAAVVIVAQGRRAAKFVVAGVGMGVTLGVLEPGVARDIVGALTVLGVYAARNK